MVHTSSDFYNNGESSGEYDDESGSGSGEEFEYDDEDNNENDDDDDDDDESDSDVDKAIVNQVMAETYRSEPSSNSESSELEFEDEERKSPIRVRNLNHGEKKRSPTEESSSLNTSNNSSQ